MPKIAFSRLEVKIGKQKKTSQSLLIQPCKKTISLLVSRYSHWYQKTKGLKYPSKINLAMNESNYPLVI